MAKEKQSRKRTGTILIVLGIFFLLLSTVWVAADIGQQILVSYTESQGGAEDMSGGGDMTIMEGDIAYMRMMTKEDSNIMNMSLDDFDLEWDRVIVNGTGIHLASGEEFDMGDNAEDPEEEEEETQQTFFPLFGVERRDYDITDPITGESITARYIGRGTVDGKEVYIYRSMSNTVVEEGGMPLETRATTIYYLHPETSIPLDIRTEVEVRIIFPDFRLLWAGDTRTNNYTTTIYTKDERGWLQEEEVIAEETISSEILSNPLLARFTEKTVYYDKNTGEPLPAEDQPPPETYVVNRSSHMYVTGMRGTERSGYSFFPTGSLRQKDYPLWDTTIEDEVLSVYKGEEYLNGETVWVFESHIDNATIDGKHPFLPIEEHPGMEYKLTMWTTYYLEPISSFPLKFSARGIAYIEPTVGGLPAQEVAAFNTQSGEGFFENMSRIAALYREVLLPMSSSSLVAFKLRMSFTQEFSDVMIDVALMIQDIMRLFKTVIPLVFAFAGAPLLLLGVRRRRKWKNNLYRNSAVKVVSVGQ